MLAAAAAYASSLSAPFIFDDEYSVVGNGAIRSLTTAFDQPYNTPLAGRPVVAFTFALNFAASGLDQAAYRATNVAIHISCALLLFGILRRTLTLPRLAARFGHSAPQLAFAVTLVWAVHPLTTDAVTYITQRTESLMAFFYLATLYSSLRAWHDLPPPPGRRSTMVWHALAIAACALGMGSKESMATAPLLVVLFDRVFLFESLRAAFAARWRLYIGLGLTWWVLAFQLAAAPRSGSAGFDAGVGVWTYLVNQAVMIVRYLRLALWPSDLVINYGAPVACTLRDVLPQAGAVTALLLMTLAAFRWSPSAAFLGTWFFVTLAPTSSFVPIATEVGAERRMYLPLMAVIALAVAGTYGAGVVRRRLTRPVALALLAAVATGLGAATIRRNTEHQSWLVLAQTTLERWPTDAAHAGVGSELARLRRDHDALPHLRIGARSDPRARYNLGVTLFNLGRYDEAIRELDALVAEHPMREEVPWARRTMGYSYLRRSQWSAAIAQLRMTLAMTPHDAEARHVLVDAYSSLGVDLAGRQRFDEAIAEFRQALSIDDSNASARYNLATALFDAGRMQESYVEAQRVLALDSANADGYHLIGKLLALQGRLEEALINLETALKLRPDDSTIREDLARVRQLR